MAPFGNDENFVLPPNLANFSKKSKWAKFYSNGIKKEKNSFKKFVGERRVTVNSYLLRKFNGMP